jgi:ribosomal protein S14
MLVIRDKPRNSSEQAKKDRQAQVAAKIQAESLKAQGVSPSRKGRICRVCGAKADIYVNEFPLCVACFEDRQTLQTWTENPVVPDVY